MWNGKYLEFPLGQISFRVGVFPDDESLLGVGQSIGSEGHQTSDEDGDSHDVGQIGQSGRMLLIVARHCSF